MLFADFSKGIIPPEKYDLPTMISVSPTLFSLGSIAGE
jgi:hypothetical protein